MFTASRTDHHKKMPAGAIKSVEEMLDIVIEARKEKKAIRIWTVTQSGYVSCFYIYSQTKLYKPGGKHPDPNYPIDNINYVLYPIVKDHSSIGYTTTNKRWFKSNELLESYGINSRFSTEHRMFQNEKHARNYGALLANDPIYMEDVRRHHKACDELFSSFDRDYD